MNFLFMFWLFGKLGEQYKAKQDSILRSPTGHRINRDGRIVDSKGRIL